MAASNRERSEKNLIRFEAGKSGNPRGRPPSLARLVKEQIGDDGREAVEFMLEVMRDERRAVRDRMAAADWLVVRGFGKAPDHVYVEPAGTGGFPSINLDRLSLDQLRQLRDLYDIANPPMGEVNGGGS